MDSIYIYITEWDYSKSTASGANNFHPNYINIMIGDSNFDDGIKLIWTHSHCRIKVDLDSHCRRLPETIFNQSDLINLQKVYLQVDILMLMMVMMMMMIGTATSSEGCQG